MCKPLRYTLLTEGSSDETLKFPVNWALQECGVTSFVDQWADLRLHPSQPKRLWQRVRVVQADYPCDLLFVHRDADGGSLTTKLDEIQAAVARASVVVRAVCVVPVKMTEAWLLHDEQAIRSAAGNPRGRVRLSLPAVSAIEDIANPKRLLKEALLDASESRGQRRSEKSKNFPRMRFRVAELVSDWAPLRQLSAFRHFESLLSQTLASLNR